MSDFAGIGERWKGWGNIATALIALISLICGSGIFYNEIWLSKVLSYTILPTYDLGSQTFTGLVIENRGRVNLTDIQIILADLGSPIQAINMPGAHEPAQVVSGGIGDKKAQIEMPRLSQGGSLAIYLLASGPATLDNKTLFISSMETVGTPSPSPSSNSDSWWFYAVVSGISAVGGMLFVLNLFRAVWEFRTQQKVQLAEPQQ